MTEEIIEFLKENLSIELDQITEFGPIETIRIRLKLEDAIISESSCTIPRST